MLDRALMRASTPAVAAVTLLAALYSSHPTAAGQIPDDDWPQLLGPARNGAVAAQIAAWPADGPAIRWRRPVDAELHPESEAHPWKNTSKARSTLAGVSV